MTKIEIVGVILFVDAELSSNQALVILDALLQYMKPKPTNSKPFILKCCTYWNKELEYMNLTTEKAVDLALKYIKDPNAIKLLHSAKSDSNNAYFEPAPTSITLPSGSFRVRPLYLLETIMVSGKKKEMRCDFCKKLITPSPKVFSGFVAEYLEGAENRGKRCPKCGKITCLECSFKAAMSRNIYHFICPECLTDIHDSKYDIV